MTLRVSDDIRWRTIDGEVVIVSQRSGEVLGLNETGSRLLELIAAHGLDLDGLVDALAREFDGSRETIAADARALAAELVAAGVLVDSAERA